MRRSTSIVREHGVAIGLAVESGSRAWGFPSPDSDYDCRFVYIRPIAHYLTPWPRRDVIELPLVDELDVNGWDLAKSLKLLMKGNAVIIEWLTSPLVYRGDEKFRSSFLALARAVADRDLAIRHYLHLSEEFRRRHLSDPAAVPLKKLFYTLRPAAAIRWLARHPEAVVAPMHFPTLMAESDLPPDVSAIVADLLACKATTREAAPARYRSRSPLSSMKSWNGHGPAPQGVAPASGASNMPCARRSLPRPCGVLICFVSRARCRLSPAIAAQTCRHWRDVGWTPRFDSVGHDPSGTCAFSNFAAQIEY